MTRTRITDIQINSTYSTSEAVTGSKWVNGNDIYRKTVNFGALPNTTSKSVAHGITGLTQIINIEGVTTSGIPVNFANPLSLGSAVGCVADGTNITVITGANRTADSVYITLWYIK